MRNGGYFEYKPMFVEKLPIPLPSNQGESEISNIIDDILVAIENDIPIEKLEIKLNKHVAALYNLNDEEYNCIMSL